ncbi:MAG TPA: ABC transporter permease [Myxococcales bacterium]|nr:ABC transporter permease [Myxococcales bacterium]
MHNLRFALRSLFRAPGFTASAVLVLALGVGGSTAVFSVLRGVVLRPLSLPHPQELIRIYERPAGTDVRWPFSGPDYLDVANESTAFASVAGIRPDLQTLTGRGSPVQIRVARITSSFFAALRVYPAIGRGPAAEEDISGGARTAVLTNGFWRREFGADPSAVGRTLVLNGRTYDIGGVMPPDFHFPLLRQAEVLIPLALEGREKEFRGMNWLTAVARLKPGLGVRQAQSDLDVLSPRIHARIGEHQGWRMEAQPLLDDLVGPVKPALTALFGAVLLALLIGCANVASLLLARGMARQRELAIRSALGGGRRELVTQLLTEALILAAFGGGLAVLLAPWALSGLLRLAPRDLPRIEEIRIDGAVLGFALATSMVAGLLAGLVPALQVTQPRLLDVLKNGAGGSRSKGRARMALMVGETALAFVLASGAGLMIRTLSGLLDVPSGVVGPDRVLVADLDLPLARYPAERIASFAPQLLQRVSALPSVRSAALTTSVPLDPRGRSDFGFSLEGGDPFPPGQAPKTEILWATPGYLETMGIPLRRGRDLAWSDVKTSPHVALVNEAFVRRFIPQGDPLGRRISEVVGPGNDPWQIAGVIGDVRSKSLDQAPSPLVVLPLEQYQVAKLRVAVRAAAGDPLLLLGPLRAEVLALDKDLPLSQPQLLSRIVSESLGERQFEMTLLSTFAMAALLLAALGIYGVTAYSVTQRSREIGIRMALGADPRRVLGMVVGGGLRLASAGVVLGVLVALAATRALASLLYGVSTTDPLTLAATAAVLVVSAALASLIPARRATRVDPAVSLRVE